MNQHQPFNRDPFPGEAATADRHHNQPPIGERLVMEFDENIAKKGLAVRVEELEASADKMPEKVEDDATASKVGDLMRMVKAADKAIEDERVDLNRPVLDAQRNLKARADAIRARLAKIEGRARALLDAFMAEKRRQEAEERRRAEEAAEAARKAAQDAQQGDEPAPAPVVEAAPVERQKVRTDMGGTISSRTVWKHKLTGKVRHLPDSILETERVKEAVEKVVGAAIRNGTRKIKGVEIWDEQAAAIR